MTTTSAPTAASRGGGARVAVQRFGTFLSGMVMPNIAAFIAWGLITALFIPTGWLPFAPLGGGEDADGNVWTGLVGPMITYLLPLLILGAGGMPQDLWPLPLGTQQFSTQYSQNTGAVLAYTSLSMLPAIAFFLIAEKRIVGGLTGAVKG